MEYLTNSGKLTCEISINLEDYKILKVHFAGKKPEYKTITTDSFISIDNWVDYSYGIITKYN